MKNNMKEIRQEIKRLVINKGLDNIINADLNEIHNRTGASYCAMQNAISYFRYSKQTAKYRN
jgi:hypothetical protein